MSFTSTVKDEVSRLDTTKLEDISELSGVIRNTGLITNNNINIPLGSRSIRYVRQGKTHYYSYYRNDQGYLSSIGRPEATPDDIELSDVDLTYKRNITIMPMSFNRTCEEALKELIIKFEAENDK